MSMPTGSPRLVDRVKTTLRVKRYSPRTEKTYYYWIRYFIRFNGVRHPASMEASEVKTFLNTSQWNLMWPRQPKTKH